MHCFSQKQHQPQRKESSGAAKPGLPAPAARHLAKPIRDVQSTIGHDPSPPMSEAKPDRAGVPYGTKAGPRFAYDFGRISIFPDSSKNVRANLSVSVPEDDREQEAEFVADRVMRTAAPERPRASGDGSPRSSNLGDGFASGHSTDLVHEMLGAGQPIESATRAYMESRFGHDFRPVRIHTDARAAQSARAVDALAYTVGRDIVFGAGQYASNTDEGRRLLAHELAHVAQYDRGAAETEGTPILFRQKDGGAKPQPQPKPQPQGPKAEAQPCRPVFKSLKADITGTIGVREIDGHCQLMLGEPHKSNGTTITAIVNVPADCKGTLQYVQLNENCHGIRVSNDEDIHRKTDGYWLDTKDPIDALQVSTAGDVTFKTDDSPGQGVGGMHVHVDDKFKTWLLWQPAEPANTARIPLAMVTWSWGAEADAKNPSSPDPECSKRFTVSTKHATGGTGAVTNTLPSWKNTAPDDLKTEKGKC